MGAVKRTVKNKKGATLAELCVVMALLAVVVALSVTFTTLMSRRVNQALTKDRVLDDLYNTELAIKNWIMTYDNADNYFKIENDSATLTAYCGKGTKDNKNDDVKLSSVYLSEDKTLIKRDNVSDVSVKAIVAVSFSFSTASDGKRMLYCYIYYLNPGDDTPEEIKYTFVTRAQGTVIQG